MFAFKEPQRADQSTILQVVDDLVAAIGILPTGSNPQCVFASTDTPKSFGGLKHPYDRRWALQQAQDRLEMAATNKRRYGVHLKIGGIFGRRLDLQLIHHTPPRDDY